MAIIVKKENLLKAWVSEFLLIRAIFNGATGQPLYSYQVDGDEYQQLQELLSATSHKAFDQINGQRWAGLFCLFISEWFRREYDASEGGWSWNGVEDRLSIHFNPQQRAALVESGLVGFWRRSIRLRGNSSDRDLLGSVFGEGGLPWLLVQSDSHGFGRVVRYGLKHFYQNQGNFRTTFDLMSECEHYLPQSFRTLETQQLLSGIVEQLMTLASKYPINELDDPASYLDEKNPEWRRSFPIPLDKDNARGLINDWLKDAGKRRQDRKDRKESFHSFSCTHRLLGKIPEWRISSEITLPEQEFLEMVENELSTTRFQIAFYEGEAALARGGVIYGQKVGDRVVVQFPKKNITLERRNPDEPLSLRLLANGQSIQEFYIENSELDYLESPLVFEFREDDIFFVSSSSCRVEGDSAFIRLPEGYSLLGGEKGEHKGHDVNGGEWVRISESVRVGREDDSFSVILNQIGGDDLKPYLAGRVSLYSSLPNVAYMSFPNLRIPENASTDQTLFRQFVNGKPVGQNRMNGFAGMVRYVLKNDQGDTVIRRVFGVLPRDFRVALFPSSANNLARVVVYSEEPLSVKIMDTDIRSQIEKSENETVVKIEYEGLEVPPSITLAVCSVGCVEPILLRFAYPYHGARLIDKNGSIVNPKELIIDQLLGMQLLLSPYSSRGSTFYMSMELVAVSGNHPKRHYLINVGRTPETLDLFSFQQDILQMLGAVDSQDAYIRFIVETDERLLDINIQRYIGRVHLDALGKLKITEGWANDTVLDANVSAMLVSDPKKEPIKLKELVTEGVGTGWYEVPTEMGKDGPWIIYPDQNSESYFRPDIYMPPSIDDSVYDVPVNTLHSATRCFHPFHRPNVISEQIDEMSRDFDHGGWQYLADLKTNFDHLPLSTFESWLALSRNMEALAAIVFRLGLDEDFCGRIRDELAVIWDCVPLNIWIAAIGQMRQWWLDKNLSEEMLDNILNNQKQVLRGVVAGNKCIGSYMDNGDLSGCCSSVPLEMFLPGWYQELRRTHESNRHWPVDLGGVLAKWVSEQDLPHEVAFMSSVPFSHAVAYLPVFMAFVTAGKVTLDDLPFNRAFLTFEIKMISDFDRISWYETVHAAVLSHVVTKNNCLELL